MRRANPFVNGVKPVGRISDDVSWVPGGGVALWCVTVPVDAQVAAPEGSPPTSSSDADAGLGQIIVTAQRREQSLQDVPVAVTSLDGDYLAARQIQSVEKLSSLAPGLNAGQGRHRRCRHGDRYLWFGDDEPGHPLRTGGRA
ncbi:hypothetical protein AB5I41_14775 [Sphingomonas sp. MMS24-JH45]